MLSPNNLTLPQLETLGSQSVTLSKGYKLFIPIVHRDGNYTLPKRNDHLLSGCLSYSGEDFSRSGRQSFCRSLEKWFSLPKKWCKDFTDRVLPHQILRTEQVIHGFMDSLLLFDLSFFTDDLMSIKHVVKNTIKVSAYNLDQVMGFWKEFANYCWIKSSDTETTEEVVLSQNNFFKYLLSNKLLKKFLNGGAESKQDFEKLAHLVSTRQLPCGGKTTELKAIEKFSDIVKEDLPIREEILECVKRAAELIGKKCLRKSEGKIEECGHISLACSGSVNRFIKEGGRAEEILSAIEPILSEESTKTGSFDTPFGKVFEEQGVQKWRTWCRTSTFYSFPDLKFKDYTTENLGGFGLGSLYAVGLDEALGMQICICAYIFYNSYKLEGSKIPIRVITVPEPGCKARIVTTGPWWVYVLEQALAHTSQSLLSVLPQNKVGLMRADQAWHLTKRLEVMRGCDPLPLLSSDLETATDVIPKPIIRELLTGFYDGVGITSSFRDIVIDILLSEREGQFPDGTIRPIKRGVLMGEPMARTVLTLLNDVVEELAIRQFLFGVGNDTEWLNKPVQVPWRVFAVGGDDHVAIGPKEYLLLITMWHRLCGSVISKNKHGISTKCIRYCEKLIIVPLIFGKDWSFIKFTWGNGESDYMSCPFVDSIKLRLLSPCSVTNLTFNEKNTAIGKLSSLGPQLRWLPKHITPKWKKMVRDRACNRMGSLIPPRDTPLWYNMLLPAEFGGMGLYLDDEEEHERIAEKIPAPTKLFISRCISDVNYTLTEHGKEEAFLFKHLLSNDSFRGYKVHSELERLTDFVVEFVTTDYTTKTLSWPDLKKTLKLDSEESREFHLDILYKRLAYKEGWKSLDDLKDSVKRVFLFNEILQRKAKPSAFRSEPIRSRYWKLWGQIYEGSAVLTGKDIRLAIKYKFPSLFYRNESKTYYPPGTWERYPDNVWQPNLMEEVLSGMPSLKLPNVFIGADRVEEYLVID